MPSISEDDGCEDWGKDVKVGIIDMNTTRKYTKDEYSGLHSLNDGACTSGKVVVTKVEVGVRGPVVKGVEVLREEGDVKVVADIEGSSLNYMKDTKFHNLVFGKNVRGRDSVVHRVARKNDVGKTTYYMAVEAGDYGEAWRASNSTCTDHPLTTIQRSDTDRLIEWKQKLGSICVKISTSKFVDDPRGCFVLNTSSRGPSSLYKEFMMPQVVAPGYRMIASWPADLPITEKGSAVKLFNHQTIKTGTSPAVPLVVGGIARVTQVVKKSGWGRQPAALKSATITTATSLKGSIPGNEFAFGAGVVDIDKACTPGLIYVETYENYQRFRRGVINAVELNEPSFAVSFASSNVDSVRVLQRFLTNVDDDGEMTYDGVLTYDAGDLGPEVQVMVDPEFLEFRKKWERKPYKLFVRVTGSIPTGSVSGCLTWKSRSESKPREVRTPIILYEGDSFY